VRDDKFKLCGLPRLIAKHLEEDLTGVWPVKIAKQFCWGYPAKLNFLLSVLCGFAVQNFSFFL
jgi:hypothetical protein